MKNIWGNWWFIVPVLLFFTVGLALVYFVPYGDEILFFNDLRQEPFNAVFRFITRLGEAYAYIICGVAALFWRYRFALLIALTGLVTLPIAFIAKGTFGTDRPISFFKNQGMYSNIVTVPGVELHTGQTSFPSGHTMAGFGLYSILTLMAGKKKQRWGFALALAAISVGVSRIFLVQHFLPDVLSGALLGMVVGSLVWRLNGTPFFQRMCWLDGRLQWGNKKMDTAGTE